jgi:hypothetical protein
MAGQHLLQGFHFNFFKISSFIGNSVISTAFGSRFGQRSTINMAKIQFGGNDTTNTLYI